MPAISVQVRVGPLDRPETGGQRLEEGRIQRSSSSLQSQVSSLTPDPVAQWQGRFPYKEMTGGSSPPRTSAKAESGKPKAEVELRRVLRLLPLSALISALVEQPGVLACLSRRRPSVQIRSRALWEGCRLETVGCRKCRGRLLFLQQQSNTRHGTPTSAERPSSNLGDCGFDSLPCYLNMRRLGIGRPRWL